MAHEDTEHNNLESVRGCPSENLFVTDEDPRGRKVSLKSVFATPKLGELMCVRAAQAGEACLRNSGEDPDQKFIDVRMGAVKRRLLVLSGKGGVGKSSVACNLAIALATLSCKVGLVDLDICGPSVPAMMSTSEQRIINSQYGWKPAVSPHGGVKIMSVGSLLEDSDSAVVWRGPRKTALVKRFIKDTFWGRLDYLIFDILISCSGATNLASPPGTSDEHLTVVKTLMNARPEGAIIVTTPQDVAVATIRKEISFCRKMNLPIVGVLENMSGFTCPCCMERYDLFGNGGAERLCAEYELPFLGQVPLDPSLTLCSERGGNVFLEHPACPAAVALMTVAQTIQEH